MDVNQGMNNISPTDQINWLSAMMSVDNDVNEKEYKVIMEYGLQLGMEEAKIKRIIDTSLKGMDILMRYLKVTRLPKNENLMRALIKVVFADGKIAKEELEMIRLVATKMQYSGEELKAILEDEKRKYRAQN